MWKIGERKVRLSGRLMGVRRRRKADDGEEWAEERRYRRIG